MRLRQYAPSEVDGAFPFAYFFLRSCRKITPPTTRTTSTIPMMILGSTSAPPLIKNTDCHKRSNRCM